MEEFKWVWMYIRTYRRRIIIGLVFCLLVTSLSLINPYISGRIVGDVFESGHRDMLPAYLGIMIGVTLMRTIIRYLNLLNFEQTSQNVLYDLRHDIYRRVQEQNFSFFDANRVGDIMSRMTGDLDAVRHFTAYVIYAVFENIVTFVVAIILMFTISWQLTLLMLLVAPVIFLCTFRQSKEIKPAFMLVREQFSRLNSVCQENISGNRVVKAFTKEDYEIRKFTEENQAYYQANVNSSKIWVKYLPILEFCAGLLFVVLLLAGGIMVILGKLELWQMVTINGYLWAVNNPMRIMGWIVNDIQRFVASLEKVHGMMKKRIYIYNPEEAYAPGRIKGQVEFRDVSFSYDRHDPYTAVLKNISFTAKPGDMVGIVGATGAGKTTLVNLLSRYYDVTSGAVLIDGRDVRSYNLHSLRQSIASAMQDVFLFSDTVEGNVAYGVPDAPMNAVIAASVTADADGFIREMEDGYDTIVGERGVGLSGGQKQRLSLARAIAVNPSILILDDTTSAVDMETEHEIQMALKEKYADRTTFVIAHRISSVKPADLILVLDNGELVESGTHESLLKERGYYYSLFMNQYGDHQFQPEGFGLEGQVN